MSLIQGRHFTLRLIRQQLNDSKERKKQALLFKGNYKAEATFIFAKLSVLLYRWKPKGLLSSDKSSNQLKPWTEDNRISSLITFFALSPHLDITADMFAFSDMHTCCGWCLNSMFCLWVLVLLFLLIKTNIWFLWMFLKTRFDENCAYNIILWHFSDDGGRAKKKKKRKIAFLTISLFK